MRRQRWFAYGRICVALRCHYCFAAAVFLRPRDRRRQGAFTRGAWFAFQQDDDCAKGNVGNKRYRAAAVGTSGSGVPSGASASEARLTPVPPVGK